MEEVQIGKNQAVFYLFALWKEDGSASGSPACREWRLLPLEKGRGVWYNINARYKTGRKMKQTESMNCITVYNIRLGGGRPFSRFHSALMAE